MASWIRAVSGLVLLWVLVASPSAEAQRPPGFIPPALHPEGAELHLEELGSGVYALLSDKPPVDNCGFVVGDRGVLVIDAHINADMAQRIQSAVRGITDKPILYLVNTNHFGDHTFGNYAFPDEIHIVAHGKTVEVMRDFEQQKRRMLGAVRNDASLFADTRLRLPDIVFDDFLRLDLGGRTVELYHFGAGNTVGEVIVYLPDAKVAWTGNLVLGQGSIPFLVSGNPGEYLSTLARLAQTLDIETIVPGHGGITSGAALGRYMDYLQQLMDSVRKAHRQGLSWEETLAITPLWERFRAPSDLEIAPFFNGLHPFNLQVVYKQMDSR